MFLNKKNKESPNELYKNDKSGKLFAKKFKEDILKYPEITSDNLLILQTGKMRENNIFKSENNRVCLPDFPYIHYYLKEEFEVECEAIDLCNSVTKVDNVESINFIKSDELNTVNIYINKPNIFVIAYNYIISWFY